LFRKILKEGIDKYEKAVGIDDIFDFISTDLNFTKVQLVKYLVRLENNQARFLCKT